MSEKKRLSPEEAKKRYKECFVGMQVFDEEYEWEGELWPYKIRRITWGDRNAAINASFRKVEVSTDGEKAGVNYDGAAYNMTLMLRCIVDAPWPITKESLEALPESVTDQILRRLLERSYPSEATKKT